MQMTRRDLAPREAVNRWLASVRSEYSDESLSSYWYRLKLFVEWCEAEDIESVSELDGWLLDSYVAHRQEQQPTAATMKNELSTLRTWLDYCERIEIVDDGTAEKIEIPTVPPEDRASTKRLDEDAASALLSYYRGDDAQYGTRAHTLLELAWHTGARVGGIQALDVDDLQTTDAGDEYVVFRNRPETGTRLKKGPDGERPVAISATTRAVLDRYIADHRVDHTDEAGRVPLFTSEHGRPTKGTIRDWMYLATVPCVHSACPHGKDRATCEWVSYERASNCPSSRSPHQVRSGAITWMRNQGVPIEVVAGRVNASVDTIETHYDVADPMEELLERRRQHVGGLDIGQSNGDNS